MPKVNYTSAKGLFQDTGAGVRFLQEASSNNVFSTTGLLIGRDADNVDPFAAGTTTALFPVGTRLIYGDREYRYAKAGGTLVAGTLCQSAATLTTHSDKKIANLDAGTLAAVTFSDARTAKAVDHDPAAGSRAVCAANMAADLAVNQYAEGYMVIRDEEGQGYALKIRTHEALDTADRNTVVIETYDPVQVTLVKNSTEITLVHNPYSGVVLAPAAETAAIAGVAVKPLTNGQFGWLQVRGPAAVLGGGTVEVGYKVIRDESDSLGGVVQATNADAGAEGHPIGVAMDAMVDGEFSMVMLNIV